MIGTLFRYLTLGNIALGLLLSAVLIQVVVRLNYSYKLQRAGGLRASTAGVNFITAPWWMFKIARAQAQNRLLEFWQMVLEMSSPHSPNAMEVNVTGGWRALFTQEPEHIKTILTGPKFAEYGKGPEFHRVWERFLGDSIFNTDHQLWQDSRNLIRKMFIKDRISDLELMDRWVDVMIEQMPPSGQTVDMCDLFYRMTIDVITDFLLGSSVNSLENPRSQFVQAFSDVQRAQTMLTVLMPIADYVPKGNLNRGVKIMEDFIEPYIQRALAIPPEELEKINKSEKSFTFLHALAGYTRDPKMIRDQIVAVLLAGRDTTAATLSWTFYELANAPQVYAKLRKEVLDTLGTDRVPTYEDLKNMKYLTNTLNETLRLYPAVPFNVRYALQDSSLPGVDGKPDLSVVKGDAVFYCTMAMQRNLALYPPTSDSFAHPHTFSPERWEHWTPKPWTYLPFNGGPRICVGQNFAMVEMGLTIARLLQRFESMEYRADWSKQYHKVEIVGTPGHGVPVAFFEPGHKKA